MKSCLLSLQKWAILRDRLPRPITTGTSIVPSRTGHKPWSDEQIALAETKANVGNYRWRSLRNEVVELGNPSR
jgi:hypothetical protein